MISVALCVCNGAEFLEAQVASLVEQTYLPHELVVCDDSSEDDTIRRLESIRNKAPFAFQVHKNSARIGIGPNFEQAIRGCSGEVIALCDQDDIWLEEKLADFKGAFAAGADWVFCNATITDTSLAPLGYTLWERVKFTRQEQNLARKNCLFETLLKHYVVAGATMAFRADLRDAILPIPNSWHYDAWLTIILAAISKGVIIDTTLQLYRQHENNAIGAMKRKFFDDARTVLSLNRKIYLEEEIIRWEHLAERLVSLDAPIIFQMQLDAKIAHLKYRMAIPKIRLLRIPRIITEILRGGYSRFSRNWGSIAIDILLK